jgi:hypothetical protein
MNKKMYLRRDEKDDIVAIACLQGLLEQRISDWEKFRPQDKELLKSIKMAKTYTKKALKIMFDSIDPTVLVQVQKHVETKQIVVLDSNDAKLVRKREDEDAKAIKMSIDDFTIMTVRIRKEYCSTCIGNQSKDDCFWREILSKYGDVTGSLECSDGRCPFAD